MQNPTNDSIPNFNMLLKG